MKKIIGAGLIALPFVVLAILISQIEDVKMFIGIFGFVALSFGAIFSGICLAFDE